jgi:hypothetical protein
MHTDRRTRRCLHQHAADDRASQVATLDPGEDAEPLLAYDEARQRNRAADPHPEVGLASAKLAPCFANGLGIPSFNLHQIANRPFSLWS